MKNLLLILFLFSLVISIREDFQNYTLIFQDHFNSIETFEKNWELEIGTGDNGWGNSEKQYYRTSKDNIFIEDNQLHIKAIKNKFKDSEYTSGRITTKKSFQFAYGYVKTRMKLPKAKGISPSFWMLGENIEKVGWPNCGEIDFIKTINDNDIVINNLHWFDDGTKDKGDYGSENIVPNKDEFHIYELFWEEDYITIYIDGNQTYIIDIEHIATNAFTKQFYFILNLAVGGEYPGDDIDDSKFPLEIVVDYIEVYQQKYNYKYNPKFLLYEMAPEFKPWPLIPDDYIFLKDGILHVKDFKYFFIPNFENMTCFKYGELKMEVSLPDAKGISSKIYLFNRETFYYYIKEKKSKATYYYERNKKYNGEIAVAATKDGSHKIISGAKWGKGDYFNETNEFDPSGFNKYLLKWDENFIAIYANDIEIYKVDIKTLPDFRNYYYFLSFINEKINENYKGNTPEIRFKELKVYQYVNDTIIGMPNISKILNLNNWLLIIFIFSLLSYF